MYLNATQNRTMNYRSIGGSIGIVLALVLATSSSVFAQNVPRAQTAAAEALFAQGRALMETGDYAQACPKLAESQRLDPASGTLLNLGICYQKAGKTASAWGAFKEAVVMARRDNRPERVAFAEEQIAELEPTLSYLTVSVNPDSRVEGLEVRIDGASLGAGAWGTAIPTNPGKHKVEASAPGSKPWSAEVELGASQDKQAVAIPLLHAEARSEEAPPPAQPPATPAATTTEPVGVDTGVGSGGQSTLGYVIGGAGIVALGVGSYFGAKALSSWSDRNDHCPDAGCDGQAVTYGDDASKYGYIADVGIGVGLVGVGVGTYLLLTAPSSENAQGGIRVEPVVARDSAGMSLGGVW